MRFCTLITVAVCLLAWPALGEVDKPKRKEAPKAATKDAPQQDAGEIVLYPVANSPASQVGSVVLEVLGKDAVKIVADDNSNMLLIRAAPESRERVVALLKHLDRAPRTVIVHAYLLKLVGEPLSDDESASLSGPSDAVAKQIASLQRDDRLRVSSHFELAALEKQTTLLQIGEQTAVATGFSSFGGTRQTRTYQAQQVGTLLKVEARTTPADAIALTVDFESSQFEPVEASQEQGDETPSPPNLTTLTHNSTLQLDSGQAILSGALAGGSRPDSAHTYLVVSAQIAKTPIKQRVASANTISKPGGGDSAAPAATGNPRPGADRKQPKAADRRELDPRYLAYYTKVVAKYDQDGDGKLVADEWKSMAKDPAEADRNEDGFITPQELTEWSIPRR